jgi:hypothetical protein
MLRRLERILRYTIREEEFLSILGACVRCSRLGRFPTARRLERGRCPLLRGGDADDIDHDRARPRPRTRRMKLFTVFYVLLGIGILVEIVRRLGFAFVSVRASDDKAKDATRGGSAEGRGQHTNRMKAPRSAETIVKSVEDAALTEGTAGAAAAPPRASGLLLLDGDGDGVAGRSRAGVVGRACGQRVGAGGPGAPLAGVGGGRVLG